MYTVLVILHVLVSLAIIAIVLLQAGKGADIGSAFGGGSSQTVFGSMGTPTLLGKITTGVAIVFIVTSPSTPAKGLDMSPWHLRARGSAGGTPQMVRPMRNSPVKAWAHFGRSLIHHRSGEDQCMCGS